MGESHLFFFPFLMILLSESSWNRENLRIFPWDIYKVPSLPPLRSPFTGMQESGPSSEKEAVPSFFSRARGSPSICQTNRSRVRILEFLFFFPSPHYLSMLNNNKLVFFLLLFLPPCPVPRLTPLFRLVLQISVPLSSLLLLTRRPRCRGVFLMGLSAGYGSVVQNLFFPVTR